ncbi:MAG: hypothetical protein JEY71_14120 [Sphaerochaeta sp.]|nr:hypothetical protein [Sphaerochaeta sp.]
MKSVSPFLSYPGDFAQIVGTNIPVVEAKDESSNLIKLSENCNAQVPRNVGALCWTTTRPYAEAVAMILEKNCKAALLSLL